jgi:uncharacterized protein YqgC (DUF456 family)
MLPLLIVLGYIIFMLTLFAGIAGVVLGLPGVVLILADGIVFAVCTHWQRPTWQALAAVAVLAFLAEISDNLMSMLGTRHGGGSSRTGWIALLGGVAGAFLGFLISPLFSAIGLAGGMAGFIVGVLIVPLGFAATGGYCAVYWYERRLGAAPERARRAAKGAVFGRLLGIMSKTIFAIIMSAVLLWAVFVPLLHHN